MAIDLRGKYEYEHFDIVVGASKTFPDIAQELANLSHNIRDINKKLSDLRVYENIAFQHITDFESFEARIINSPAMQNLDKLKKALEGSKKVTRVFNFEFSELIKQFKDARDVLVDERTMLNRILHFLRNQIHKEGNLYKNIKKSYNTIRDFNKKIKKKSQRSTIFNKVVNHTRNKFSGLNKDKQAESAFEPEYNRIAKDFKDLEKLLKKLLDRLNEVFGLLEKYGSVETNYKNKINYLYKKLGEYIDELIDITHNIPPKDIPEKVSETLVSSDKKVADFVKKTETVITWTDDSMTAIRKIVPVIYVLERHMDKISNEIDLPVAKVTASNRGVS